MPRRNAAKARRRSRAARKTSERLAGRAKAAQKRPRGFPMNSRLAESPRRLAERPPPRARGGLDEPEPSPGAPKPSIGKEKTLHQPFFDGYGTKKQRTQATLHQRPGKTRRYRSVRRPQAGKCTEIRATAAKNRTHSSFSSKTPARPGSNGGPSAETATLSAEATTHSGEFPRVRCQAPSFGHKLSVQPHKPNDRRRLKASCRPLLQPPYRARSSRTTAAR